MGRLLQSTVLLRPGTQGLIKRCRSLSLLHLAEGLSVYIFVIFQLDGCATDEGSTLLGLDTLQWVKNRGFSLRVGMY